MGFLPLEAATEHASIPAWVFGVAAFVVLMIMLAVVRGFGHSRPHS